MHLSNTIVILNITWMDSTLNTEHSAASSHNIYHTSNSERTLIPHIHGRAMERLL